MWMWCIWNWRTKCTYCLHEFYWRLHATHAYVSAWIRVYIAHSHIRIAIIGQIIYYTCFVCLTLFGLFYLGCNIRMGIFVDSRAQVDTRIQLWEIEAVRNEHNWPSIASFVVVPLVNLLLKHSMLCGESYWDKEDKQRNSYDDCNDFKN